MKLSSRLGLSVLALGMPLLAFAAPANVTGITAVLEDDGVHVSWNNVEGDIAAYRVFYSHTSILEAAGLYDDFERTSGSETTHILRNVPDASDLYVSVLAVDSKGEESAYFTEEAHVALTGESTAVSSAAIEALPPSTMEGASSAMPAVTTTPTASSAMTAMPTDDVLQLLSIDVVSSTGITLHFSHMVTIDPALATQAFMIKTASGTKLAVKRLIVQGNNVHVDTEVQTQNMAYKVTVGAALSAAGSAGQRLAIPPDQSPVLFSGHETGKAPTSMPSRSSATSVASVTKRSEVTQLRLRAQPTGKTYRVEAVWQPAGGMVKNYTIAQTTDGGKTFGATRTINPAERDVIVSDVPAGSFGMQIKTIYSDNTTSKGVVQILDLPATGGSVLTGSLTKGSTQLPNSGPALWVAIIVTGSAAGYLQTRRKKIIEQVA